MNSRKAEKLVEAWNREHVVGAPVTVRRDDGTELQTRTRSAAQVLSGHTAVIWVDGIAGCYDLQRVTPRTSAEFTDAQVCAIEAGEKMEDEA
jgi:hypothetical protein